MRYAVVNEDSIVESIIEWDGKTAYNPGFGLALQPVLESEYIDVGWFFNGKEFLKPKSE